MGRQKQSLKNRKLRKPKYSTLQKAAQAARRLKVRTARDYYRKCKQDPLLPADPENYYGHMAWKKLGGWKIYLTKRKYHRPYKTIAEAMVAVQKLGIQSWREYDLK